MESPLNVGNIAQIKGTSISILKFSYVVSYISYIIVVLVWLLEFSKIAPLPCIVQYKPTTIDTSNENASLQKT